jgi:hypothetical protein
MSKVVRKGNWYYLIDEDRADPWAYAVRLGDTLDDKRRGEHLANIRKEGENESK